MPMNVVHAEKHAAVVWHPISVRFALESSTFLTEFVRGVPNNVKSAQMPIFVSAVCRIIMWKWTSNVFSVVKL